MAPTLEYDRKRCYYCGVESTDHRFKYYDNKKTNQPRFQCGQCKRLFTVGSHGRPQGKTYKKKRNVDPPELQGLLRDCPHCGVADNSRFKYYNNNRMSQPRFKCLSCGMQFQMRLMVDGDARHLVHASSKQRLSKNRTFQAPLSDAWNMDGEMNLQVDGVPTPVDLTDPNILDDIDVEDFMNVIEDALAAETNEAGIMNNVETLCPATNASLDLCPNPMVENAPESFTHLMQSGLGDNDVELANCTELGFNNESNEAEAMNNVNMPFYGNFEVGQYPMSMSDIGPEILGEPDWSDDLFQGF